MKPICLVLALVLAVVTAALPAGEDRACPPSEARSTLVPVADEPKEPTLAPPEPANEHSPGQIVVVRVEGEVPAPVEPLPAMAPVPDPQGEPTPAPPQPLVRPAGVGGLQMIVVQVEAEQAIEEGLPADHGGPDQPGLTVP